VLVNKVDLAPAAQAVSPSGAQAVFAVSARTGQGIPDLLAWLEHQVAERAGGSESMPMTRVRHRTAIQASEQFLERFLSVASAHEPAYDLLAEDLRLAARELGRITGRIDVEDYLDVIFRDFCIGK
jgi:tRNA modification GTPase